ncbi:MAG: universal stress protein [Desulfuromonadales bacterium]
MSIKDILLYLDDSFRNENRIEVALNLARVHSSTLTGISILTHEYYQPRQNSLEERLAAGGELLQNMAHGTGVQVVLKMIESAVVGTGVRELLTGESHCSDLLITGQESRRRQAGSAVVERLILASGRPVLVVPTVGTFPTVGTKILVAWRNGREAGRVIHDALPVLKKAGQVTLLSVADDGNADGTAWERILQHLAHHGVNARTDMQPATSAPLADTVLNLACEGGFDLLIMGAFCAPSRSGARLGPAASQILRQMTIPVLMSH